MHAQLKDQFENQAVLNKEVSQQLDICKDGYTLFAPKF